MTIKELIEYIVTHKINVDAEIYVNGIPITQHLYYYKPKDEYCLEDKYCYKIDLRNDN